MWNDFCKAFPEDDFYLNPDAVRTVVLLKFQFKIIHTMSGLKVDVMIPRETEFESSRRSRVKIISTPRGMRIPFVSPEDLIIRKMQYFKEGGSDKHLRDIASMLLIQADAIDLDYISSWVEKLDVKEVWQEILTEENRSQRNPQARHQL